MRLLFVSHESFPRGATKSAVTLAVKLQESYNCKIHFMIPFDREAAKYVRQHGLEVITARYYGNYRKIGIQKKWKEMIKQIINSFQVRRLSHKLDSNQYDYVISNSTAIEIGAELAARMKVPHVFYVREFMDLDFGFEYLNPRKMERYFKIAYKSIFISESIAKYYLDRFDIKNYRIIYNGIDLQPVYIPNHSILYDEELRILQIGTICEGKGCVESVEMIWELVKYLPCHLTFVGDSSPEFLDGLNQTIERKGIQDKVSILSYTESIKKEFLQNDILLMNSKCEGFGRVTVEGMIGGLLVAGRNSGATSEIIHDDETGLLFDNKDDFVEKMMNVYNKREYYREVAKRGQKEAIERFSASKNAYGVWDYIKK